MQYGGILGSVLQLEGTSGPPPCNHTSCEACAAAEGCGWCAESHRCLQHGEGGGPCNADECRPDFFLRRTCTASGLACSMHAECSDCVLDPDCGWCGALSRCVDRTERLSACPGSETTFLQSEAQCARGSTVTTGWGGA